MKSDPTDFELLQAWRAGDKRAGDDLLRRHFATVYRFFRSKVDGDIKDLIQATFLGCVESRERVSDGVNFRAYLLGIAHNKLLHDWRKHHRRAKAYGIEAEAPPGSVLSPSRVAVQHEEQRALLLALRTLPMDLQILVELHYWEELSLREIGYIVGAPVGTIKSRLARARDRLRDVLTRQSFDEVVLRSTIDDLEHWARSLRALLDADRNEPVTEG